MRFDQPLAVVCTTDLGWKTVRKRWESALPLEFETVRFFNPEERERSPKALFSRTLRQMLNTRAAATDALASGARHILVATNTDAVLLPRKSGAQYYIYMDAAHAQGRRIYSRKPPDRRMKSRIKKMRILAKEGHSFLCMSRLAAHGAATEYGAKTGQIFVVPPPVDTDLFSPLSPKHEGSPMRILFVGADFQRKGGDILLDLAKDPDFAGCEWNFLTDQSNRPQNPAPNLIFHDSYPPDSDALVRAFQKCDVLALPTRADMLTLASVEAHSCGLPVIIRNIGATSEVVEDRVSGFVIDRCDAESVKPALLTYLRDPKMRQMHGAAGRAQVMTQNSYPVHARREVVEGKCNP